MRTIHNINKWSFIITLVLYIGVFTGAMAQIVLGFIQIVFALSLFLRWQEINTNSKQLIIIYWFLVITFGLIHLIFRHDLRVSTFFYLIVPMCIAAYFVFVTYKFQKNLK